MQEAVEELLSGESCLTQLCRRYNISSSLLYHWKRQYSRGKGFVTIPLGLANNVN
ncbi:transposase [Chloroflexota bacterium]